MDGIHCEEVKVSLLSNNAVFKCKIGILFKKSLAPAATNENCTCKSSIV